MDQGANDVHCFNTASALRNSGQLRHSAAGSALMLHTTHLLNRRQRPRWRLPFVLILLTAAATPAGAGAWESKERPISC